MISLSLLAAMGYENDPAIITAKILVKTHSPDLH